MRLRISKRGHVHPSIGLLVRLSRVIFEQQKRHFLCSDDDEIWHGPRDSQGQFINDIKMSVHWSVCLSDIKNKKKCRRGSHILWTPRFLLFLECLAHFDEKTNNLNFRNDKRILKIWKMWQFFLPPNPATHATWRQDLRSCTFIILIVVFAVYIIIIIIVLLSSSFPCPLFILLARASFFHLHNVVFS